MQVLCEASFVFVLTQQNNSVEFILTFVTINVEGYFGYCMRLCGC